MENKYELIIKYIEELALSNKLKQGGRLPSIRELAEKFECNKATVIRGYQELEMNHKIYSIPKSGYYLVEKETQKEDEYGIIDFSRVLPEPKLLPYKEFNHCINKAVELYKNNLFTYGDTEGLESLRKALVSYFSERQIFTPYENIFITSGSQQAISILAKMSFPNGKKNILVEQPTYSLMNRIVELNGDKLLGIDRDFKGIDLNKLEEIFKKGDIKFFYTIPRFHNPLGTSYSEKQKIRIAELAEKYDVYIVEDDYLGDVNSNKKVLPLYYYSLAHKVVYVKSFSKAFMPGVRIGGVVLGEELREEFLKHKKYLDLNTSVLSQAALEIFISSGMYSKHIKKAQREYSSKMNYLQGCINGKNMDGIEVFIPRTGFFVWMKLPQNININLLIRQLENRNVFVSPAKEHFMNEDCDQKAFRLCISKLSREEIRTGINILFEEIEKVRDRHGDKKILQCK